jgi:DNA-binding transcriptional ArsR family regulator
MDTFSALADPTRRRLIELLAAGDRSAGSLVAAFPRLSQPAVSRHLRVLRQAGLVMYNRQAQRRIYSLERGGLGEVEMWLERTTRDWDKRLSRLAAEIAASGEEDR